ncbi:MAG: addiction module protein [Deltaproteobacteria bacterium]|nr:addiction module protein [Deltaproteobacteria bacterium]
MEIDRIWAEEVRKRWQAYRAGELEIVSYDLSHSMYGNTGVVVLEP